MKGHIIGVMGSLQLEAEGNPSMEISPVFSIEYARLRKGRQCSGLSAHSVTTSPSMEEIYMILSMARISSVGNRLSTL